MTPRFDLVDIAKTIQIRRKLIIGITVAAAILGVVGYLVQKKKYKAIAEFLVTNPEFADRSNIFRNVDTRSIDYFASEEDIDRVMAIAKSDMVRNQVIRNTDLYKIYELDPNNVDDQEKMGGKYKKNFEIQRTENKNLEVSYIDHSPKVSADVTNEIVRVVEETYRNYFNTIKGKMIFSLQNKAHEVDSNIALLTDSLAHMRDRYKIYGIVSPNRQSIVSGDVKPTAADFGRGIEQIQNVEAMKDQFVMDRAKYASLLNEFETGTRADELSYVKVVSSATPPVKPTGLGFILSVIACTFVGFFVAVLAVLFSAYYRALISVER
ncbi:Wzz/FepE/Etk N-terminal domain-containing protein [Taibaiella soli]|uniref:Polysaccharide chain length determinant N-terminal domain-containing protein n=1 Tax=Taibaiella soli TaxID=1649169 RepID=A0A2W2AK03_9BACT|nr:Wzz/FepE/Etk N-terminal domain-containing protein [Taibaiella soli]PZF73882.1 hypothetical protein DN068_05945 [Taibaiella soli]